MPTPRDPTATENTDDRSTGLPGLTSWRAVYVCVFGIFVLWVVLLAAFTRIYS